ncbi:oxidoreductase [Hypoxylon rubiginosum]|uniref:Oxidoreductase n=1 Tax=Hypoxylon rubiginosum TaxID=110542 RepID=A0ACB9YVF3_9PEZI|nr:oxidoreductase [Hypoxylon rubiginosum]
MSGIKFDKSSIPDLAGRVLLVTGGTGGIGAEIVVELAKHNPGRIFFTGRNAEAAEKTVEHIKAVAPNVVTTFVTCDLANLATVRHAADKILAETPRLDLFLANAGIMAKPAGLSTDGYEVHFATNHMGHALLTKKLLPLLEQTADLPDSDESAILGRWVRYSNSKLANMLYARELARRHPKLLSFSVHPGAVETGLVNDLKFTDRLFVRVSMMGQMVSVEEGTFNHLWAVSAPRDSIKQGGFYEPVGFFSSEDGAIAKEKKFAEKLWEYTEEELETWMH